MDEVVGRLRDTLDRRGLAERTAIIFTGDNGFYLGELGLAGKWFPHEASIRIPLVIRDPRLPGDERNRRVAALALNIDLAPTILDLAGLDPGPETQGASLAPLLRGEVPGWRQSFFYEHLFEHPRIPRSQAVRGQRWKYVRYLDVDPPCEELYDLKADPQELQNLAPVAGYASILKEQRQAWERWRVSVE